MKLHTILQVQYKSHTQVDTSASTCVLLFRNPQAKSNGISTYPTTSSMVRGREASNSNICRTESEQHMANASLNQQILRQAEPTANIIDLRHVLNRGTKFLNFNLVVSVGSLIFWVILHLQPPPPPLEFPVSSLLLSPPISSTHSAALLHVPIFP